MKPRHVSGARLDARATLGNLRIRVGQTFESLSGLQRASIAALATRSNLSTRAYFDLLQRRAR